MAQPSETPPLIHAVRLLRLSMISPKSSGCSAAKIVDDFSEIIGLFGC